MEQISYPYWEAMLVFGDNVLSVITASPCGSSVQFVSLQLLVGVSRPSGYFEGCFPHALYAERANWEKVCVVPAHSLEENRRRNIQSQPLLLSILDGDKWPVSCPGRLTPESRASFE